MCLIRNFLCLVLLFTTQTLLALPADKNERLLITSDSSTYHYKNSTTVFEGHVKVDQGTTHILADKLVAKINTQHQIKELVAYGMHQLAHYTTIPKLNEPVIHANAEIIKFYPANSNTIFEQNVTIVQGENSFKGQRILYNRNDQTILVPATQGARAVMVYNPDK